MTKEKTCKVLAILAIVLFIYWAMIYFPALMANGDAIAKLLKDEISLREREYVESQFNDAKKLGPKLLLGYVGVAAIMLVVSKDK